MEEFGYVLLNEANDYDLKKHQVVNKERGAAVQVQDENPPEHQQRERQEEGPSCIKEEVKEEYDQEEADVKYNPSSSRGREEKRPSVTLLNPTPGATIPARPTRHRRLNETSEEAEAKQAKLAKRRAQYHYERETPEARREISARDAVARKLHKLNQSEEAKAARAAKISENRKAARARVNEVFKQTVAGTMTNNQSNQGFRCNLCTTRTPTKPVAFDSETLLQIHNRHVHPTVGKS